MRLDKGTGVVLLSLVGVYALSNGPWPGFFKSYLFCPLLWCAVVWMVRSQSPVSPTARPSLRRSILQMGLVLGVLQVTLYGIGGLFSGFGKSPSSFALPDILQNVLVLTSSIVGAETSRAWLVRHLSKKHTFLVLAVVSGLYTGLLTPLAQFSHLRPSMESLSYISSNLIPFFAENLFASVLAVSAGPKASIAYRGVLGVFWWFSPVLPDLSWALKGLFGTGIPIIGTGLIGNGVLPQARKMRRLEKESSPVGWVITSVFSVALIWFAVGIFPVRPSLIGSGSMTPAMQVGDVVIVAKVPADRIKVGDVIQFRVERGVSVIHRVVDITREEGRVEFVTKGDANDTPDQDTVIPENVIGKAVFTARKIGWPAALLKGAFGN